MNRNINLFYGYMQYILFCSNLFAYPPSGALQSSKYTGLETFMYVNMKRACSLGKGKAKCAIETTCCCCNTNLCQQLPLKTTKISPVTKHLCHGHFRNRKGSQWKCSLSHSLFSYIAKYPIYHVCREESREGTQNKQQTNNLCI